MLHSWKVLKIMWVACFKSGLLSWSCWAAQAQKGFFALEYSISLAPVVQKMDNAIHRINHYPLDSAIGFPNTSLVDSDLSGRYCYPTFEQLTEAWSLQRFGETQLLGVETAIWKSQFIVLSTDQLTTNARDSWSHVSVWLCGYLCVPWWHHPECTSRKVAHLWLSHLVLLQRISSWEGYWLCQFKKSF